ncbi:MAG: hypothetical protein ACLP9L_17385 [Thermoguttaceae bacterium]
MSNLFQAAIVVKSQRTIVSSILLGLTPLLFGCGRGKGVDRFPVHGTVTRADGEKVSGSCSITFLPAKGWTGPAANTALVEGSYKFDRSDGPTTGLHTVIVKRFVPRSRIPVSLADKQAAEKTRTEWTQSTNVLDDGQYVHNFTVEN